MINGFIEYIFDCLGIMYSLEMLFNVGLRIVEELDAAMQIGKFTNAQTIASIQLGL